MKKNKDGELTVADIKIYLLCCHRIECISPKTGPCIYGHLIYDREATAICGRKVVWEDRVSWITTWKKKINTDHHLTLCAEIHVRCIIDPNV